jgi:hypothetical protein
MADAIALFEAHGANAFLKIAQEALLSLSLKSSAN